MKKAIAMTLSASLLTAGCATSSGNISASYVSPMQYHAYECDQIMAEAGRIRVRVNELTGHLDQAANNDKMLVGVGLILFWPALLAVGGNKQQEMEFARLKGEYEALQSAAIQKRCQAAMATPASAIRPTSLPVDPPK